jgi:hypothetical protein
MGNQIAQNDDRKLSEPGSSGLWQTIGKDF